MSKKDSLEVDRTDFGYQKVTPAEKTRKVGAVFTSVAPKYDLMNDLMSFGLHHLWKRYVIAMSGVREGQKILDLAGGTGDLAVALTKRVGKTGLVVLADINADMLKTGRQRLTDAGIAGNIQYIQGDAQYFPFPSNYFDCITIAFGLRNVTNKILALKSMYRALKPAGRVLILEFSKPIVPAIKPIYDAYSFTLLPLLGKVIAGDSESYRYLAESIRMHPDQQTLMGMMQQVGFENCEYHNLSAGIVAVHKGYKY